MDFVLVYLTANGRQEPPGQPAAHKPHDGRNSESRQGDEEDDIKHTLLS